MATVQFTRNLKRHLDTETIDVPSGTVRTALEAVLARNQRLRGYLLDDQGALRQHVTIFVDNQRVSDRFGLSDRVGAGARPMSDRFFAATRKGLFRWDRDAGGELVHRPSRFPG